MPPQLGLGSLMNLTQIRRIKLWYVGRAKNWSLVRYEIAQDLNAKVLSNVRFVDRETATAGLTKSQIGPITVLRIYLRQERAVSPPLIKRLYSWLCAIVAGLRGERSFSCKFLRVIQLL